MGDPGSQRTDLPSRAKTPHRAGGTDRFSTGERIPVDQEPLVPDYAGACVCNVVPALLDASMEAPDWLPAQAVDAEQVVLLVLDGLGWQQLMSRGDLAPTLKAMSGGPITTVAPSTTASALTSITTGLTPGLHGVVGYRMNVHGEVLNVLRWSVNGRDARELVPPEKIQSTRPFLDQRAVIVTRAEFKQSGFTLAHLDGGRVIGYRVSSTMVAEVRRQLKAREPFVYCYYDGIDKVAHEYGLDDRFDAEIRAVDHLVAEMIDALPSNASLVVTADHGEVDVGDRIVRINPEILATSSMMTGEGRFRWFHARAGRAEQTLELANRHHGHEAWVMTCQEVIDAGWLGPTVTAAARQRLGDVAMIAREPVAFFDPDDTGPYVLIGRHGSLTSDEMLVPLLAVRG